MVDSQLHQTALRGGVLAAALLFLAASVLKMGAGDHAAPAVRLLHLGEAARVSDLLAALGVVVLVVLPLLRLVALAAAWVRQGDRRYAAAAVVVVLFLICAPLLAR